MNTIKQFALVNMLGLMVMLACFTEQPAQANGGIKIIAVQSQGIGTSQRDAVLDGVREAVSMVNGVAIAAQMSLSELAIEVETDTNSSYLVSSTFQQKISTATSGLVEEYAILSGNKDPNTGIFTVNLAVKVAIYIPSKQLERLRLALSAMRIDNNVKDRAAAAEFAEDLQDGVIDYLTQTRRFAMIDRQLMAETQRELNFLASPNAATRELARLGNQVGTDYLVVLELREISSVVNERKMATINRIQRKTLLNSEVGVRIIDVATSQIKFSASVDNFANSDHRRLARKASRTIGRYIQNAIYPVRIVAIDGKLLTLGQGGNTIDLGERYSLIRLGERLYDPYTNESLGYKETSVGTVLITEVTAKQSKAEIESLDEIDLMALTGYEYIVRPIESSMDAAVDGARERLEKARGQIDALKDKFDE